jgi:TPR repeat protein
VSDVRTHSIQKNSLRYMYIAGAPDERGVIARFEIYGVSRGTYAGAARVWADETGMVRIGHAQELATPLDPLEQDDRKSASESQQRIKLGPVEMKTRCETGDQQWCLDLAAYERQAAEELILRGETADIPFIVRLYSSACDSGIASACASLGDFYLDGKIVRSNLLKAGPLLDRACTLGDGNACHRFATLLRESSTQEDADYAGRRQRAADLDQRGCGFRSGGSCLTLAEFYWQGGAPSRARAEGLFEESCRLGVAEACHRLAGIRENDQRLLLKACASGGFAECPDLNPLAGN